LISKIAQNVFVVVFTVAVFAQTVYAEQKAVATGEPSGIVTLKQAVSFALLNSPELSAFSMETRIKDANALQAGFLPNPALSVDVEDFRAGAPSGADVTETTVQVGQLFETAGKRSKRKQVAALERDLAEWDYTAKKLDVTTAVKKTFIDVLAAQRRLSFEKESYRLAGEIYDAVSHRVEAGKVSPVDEIKSGIVLSNARLKLQRAVKMLADARKQLAAVWGRHLPKFESVSGDFDVAVKPPPEEKLLEEISNNPDVARRRAEIEKKQAELALEKSQRIPDVTLSGGIRYYNETDNDALVFGLSVPIPVFNRNQGGIASAEYGVFKARDELRALELRLRAEFSAIYMELSATFTEAVVLKNDIVPAAEKAFRATQEGYRQGKFGYLEALDAQRTFFETRERGIEALAAYRKALADANRLIGKNQLEDDR